MILRNGKNYNEVNIDFDFDEASTAWRENKIELDDATYVYKSYGGMKGLMEWLLSLFQ